MANSSRIRKPLLKATVSSIALAAAIAAVPETADALIVRDDVGLAGAAATGADPLFDPVGQIFFLNNNTGGVFFNCTGTLVSRRTVLTASHCLNDLSSEDYGPAFGGTGGTALFAMGSNTSSRIFSFIGSGAPHSAGGVAQSSDVIIHPDANIDNTQLPFPFADVSLIALNEPISDFPQMGMLLSPLDGTTHVRAVGYGTFGTGTLGGLGIGFDRLAGENELALAGSIRDVFFGLFDIDIAGIFAQPIDTQTLYFFDFDSPANVSPPCRRGGFFDNGTFVPEPGFVDCPTEAAALDFNPFNTDDALPQEVGTAPGDSGSPLIADELADFPLIVGVLSGGLSLFEPPRPDNGFGDISFYNPLFLFHQFLVENMPTKYVSAKKGDGQWTDPNHWVQDLDPNFYVFERDDDDDDDDDDDEDDDDNGRGGGRIVNGIPGGVEDGVLGTTPKFGEVLGFDISGLDDTPFTELPGGDGFPQAGGGTAAGDVSLANEPLDVIVSREDDDDDDDDDDDGPSGPPPQSRLPQSSPLLGPGSKGFVPNNTDGTPGTAFENPALYFEVTLKRDGRTTLKNASIEIDFLTIDGDPTDTELRIKGSGDLTVLAGTEVRFGVLTVQGQLTTAFLYNDYGLVQGKGRIDAPLGVANWGGVVAPGGLGKIGTLTIGGDFSQSNAGTLAFEIKRKKNDLLIVEGDAALDGTLAVLPMNRLRFGDEFTLVEANAIIGDFEQVVGFGTALYGRTEIDGGDLNFIIEAERFTNLISESSPLFDFADALDGARGDFFDDLDDVFDLVDNTSLSLLEPVFQTLTPQTDLFQTPLAARSYSLNFQQRIDSRAAELRAGATGVSAAGPLNGYRAVNRPAARSSSGHGLAQSRAQAPRQRDTGFGVFIAGDATPQRDYRPDALADDSPGNMPVSLTSQGNMTIGMDYRVARNFAFGIASTVSRFDIRQTDHQPLETVSFGVAAYATYFGRNWYVDGLYGAARQHMDVERVLVGFEDVNRFADSSSAATQTFAAVKSGWTFEPAKGLTVGPTATLTYSSLHMSGYKEVNAGAFNLIVDDRTIRSMTVKSGLEFSFEHLFTGNRRFNAYGRIGAVRNFGDSRDVVTAAFAAAPDLRFDIDREIDRSWYSAGGGISYLVANKVRAHLEMSSEFDRQNLNYHTARAGLTVAF